MTAKIGIRFRHVTIAAFVFAVLAMVMAAWAVWYVRWAAPESGRLADTAGVRDTWTGAHFRLDHVSRHRYVLRNDGMATAYDVRLETGNLTVSEGALAFDDFPARNAEKYLLIQPLQGRLNEIRLHWRDRPDSPEEHTARLPLITHLTSSEGHGHAVS